MKTVVSIPNRVFHSAEKLAVRLGLSRSELYTKALGSLIEKHHEDLITSKLNEIYEGGNEHSSLETEVKSLQFHSHRGRKW